LLALIVCWLLLPRAGSETDVRRVGDTGIVILDASCWKRLADRKVEGRVRASLRAVDLTVWPTTMNVLEAAATKNTRVRTRLFDVISRMSDGRPLLSFPAELLMQVGEAIARGEPRVTIARGVIDSWLTNVPLANARQDRAVELLSGMDHFFDTVFDKARAEVQSELRALGVLDRWESLAAFLDGPWADIDNVRSTIAYAWRGLGLKGNPPVEQLLENEVWQLFVHVEGAAFYQRTVIRQRQKRVQWRDLLQLVYLAGSHHRIFVTGDKALHAAATNVLAERHPGARAMLVDDFIASA
jgi:hypothetical protein